MMMSHINSMSGLNPTTQSRSIPGTSRPSVGIDSPQALDTVTQIGDSLQHSIDTLNRTQFYHRQIPQDKAVTSLAVIRHQLDDIDKMIAKERPDLSGRWDVAQKDGKLVVRAPDMNKADVTWLQDKLNGNRKLVAAARDFTQAAIDYAQTSDANPAFMSLNGFNHEMTLYNFDEVGKQLNGKLPLKELLGSIANPHFSAGDAFEGATAMELVVTKLQSTPLVRGTD